MSVCCFVLLLTMTISDKLAKWFLIFILSIFGAYVVWYIGCALGISCNYLVDFLQDISKYLFLEDLFSWLTDTEIGLVIMISLPILILWNAFHLLNSRTADKVGKVAASVVLFLFVLAFALPILV